MLNEGRKDSVAISHTATKVSGHSWREVLGKQPQSLPDPAGWENVRR